VWCSCSIKKLCDPYLSASEASFSQWGAIQIQLPFSLPFNYDVLGGGGGGGGSGGGDSSRSSSCCCWCL